jgi:fructose-1,6-bisphosphatase
MAVKEMQNRTTNWTFDLYVENQLVCSTLNEKYFQRVEQSPIEIICIDCPHSLHINASPVVCQSITLILVDILDVSQPIYPMQPRCSGITKVLINTCMLDTLWGPYKVYFCHAWFQSMQWFFSILIKFSKHIQCNSSKPYSTVKVIG